MYLLKNNIPVYRFLYFVNVNFARILYGYKTQNHK
ncbi:hypothetical protein SAMN05444277_11047 [Parafilimonas terrae]|uniref:Uncharacterized protein n=1 Tax=Parafilimonas terrae TaxID=1465490 RepID=A0A1I5XZL6_9BACT|nr:hypothetical protein SAMN05444277_11047 [Parafilimonas terrae]